MLVVLLVSLPYRYTFQTFLHFAPFFVRNEPFVHLSKKKLREERNIPERNPGVRGRDQQLLAWWVGYRVGDVVKQIKKRLELQVSKQVRVRVG